METWELVARESVRENVAAYNVASDRGRLEDLAATFIPDGVLQIGDGDPIVGRQAIVEQLSNAIVLDPPPRFVHHHVASLHFSSVTAGEIATGAYFQVLTDTGLDHWGRYRDRLVPFEGQWLFAQRRIVADAFAPTSCFKR